MSLPRVLVTGAFGLVGRSTVKRLREAGFETVATDLSTKANQALARQAGITPVWADLTDRAEVAQLLTTTRPDVVIHLAAVIPPLCYANRRLAHRVNVEATAHLVAAASAQPQRPRFVLASSVAVYGNRNPHRVSAPVSAATPPAPSDLYGAHKLRAEEIVHDSPLDWVVLRLGGVMTATPEVTGLDGTVFGGVLPVDGRIQTVDVRDVATAFAAATTADVVGETLLIGGDASHRILQGEIGEAMTAARGMPGSLPAGRPGDPDDDTSWFATDWMDTDRAQSALGFQQHSWPDLLEEVGRTVGWSRYPMRLVGPVLHEVLRRRSPYRSMPGTYADPWGAVAATWGDPTPD